MATTTAFASVARRLGVATVGRLANATAILPFGARVDGVFRQAAATASMGSVGVLGRDVSFLCVAADLAEPMPKGAAITVEHMGATFTGTVVQAVQHHELGQIELLLEVG